MQLQDLNSQGYEVVLVSSGAVGVGRQRLRYRKLLNSRFSPSSTLSLFFYVPFSFKCDDSMSSQ
jgi:hypothetical protein